MTHATFVNDQHFRSCYPDGSKWYNEMKKVLLCRGSIRSYVDELHDMDKVNI